jgi:hypothetical protein
MIDERRARDPHFTDDLSPQMQRLAGLVPCCERQFGPMRIIAHVRILSAAVDHWNEVRK